MANKTPSKKAFQKLAYAVDEYIHGFGGNAVVVGGVRIAKRPPLKHSYTIEIDFTGNVPEKKK